MPPGPASFVLLALLLASSPPAHADKSPDFVRPPRVRPSPLDELTADGRPTPAAIAVLRSHARGRLARVWVGDTHYDVRDVRLDSVGILVTEPRTDTGSPPSTIPWSTIDGLETRRSRVLPGIIVGTLVTTIGGLAVGDALGPDPGPGIAILLAFPPAGALVGGLVGAALPRWQHEWPPATRPPR